jgi:hypothetical protein
MLEKLSRLLRRLRSSLTGPDRATPSQQPQVIVYDPAAEGPHDLDDPFFDSQVQTRIAGVIADAGQKK